MSENLRGHKIKLFTGEIERRSSGGFGVGSINACILEYGNGIKLDTAQVAKIWLALIKNSDPHGKTERLIRTLSNNPGAGLDQSIDLVKQRE
jgi:hypothetical protein